MGGRCVARAPVAAPQPDPCDKLEPVYFDFDRSDLRPESRTALQATAKCVADKGIASLRVEGNCDERGTTEYNLHLGQRRADAVKGYLVNLGVPARSVTAVSNGEERPLCTEHGEACWQRNRRADTLRQ
jgi:peptidoglycan-associated lipoprotein